MAVGSRPSDFPVARPPYVEAAWLFRAIGIATDARKLILGAAGILLLWLGWSLILGEKPERIDPGRAVAIQGDGLLKQVWGLATQVAEPAQVVVEPVALLFQPKVLPVATWRLAAMGLWAVAVWGVIGGAIARIAVVQAATGEKPGLATALRFALRKVGSLVGAPLIPFVAVFAMVAFNTVFGALCRLPGGELGESVAAALLIVPILVSIVMALILLGLALGWPFMAATVATEDEDAADALSRSYSYVNQRFFRFVAHVAMAWLVGVIGLFLAIQFTAVVLGLAQWSSTLLTSEGPGSASAVSIRDGWVRVVNLVVQAWIYSFFWSVVPLIYLVLRRDVDGTDLHDVALPGPAAESFADELVPDAPKVAKTVDPEV